LKSDRSFSLAVATALLQRSNPGFAKPNNCVSAPCFSDSHEGIQSSSLREVEVDATSPVVGSCGGENKAIEWRSSRVHDKSRPSQSGEKRLSQPPRFAASPHSTPLPHRSSFPLGHHVSSIPIPLRNGPSGQRRLGEHSRGTSLDVAIRPCWAPRGAHLLFSRSRGTSCITDLATVAYSISRVK